MLKAAWALLVSSRWARGGPTLLVDADGRDAMLSGRPAVALTLLGAIASVPAEKLLDLEFARRQLRRVLWEHNLQAWNDHPLRTKRQVLGALQRTIRDCQRAPPARGGWRVSMGPPKSNPKEQPNASS